MKLNNDAMNLGGTSIVLRKQALQQNPQMKKISDTYNEHAKLVFLFDVSGSMSAPIARTLSGESFADMYVWTAEILQDIRNRVGTAINEYQVAAQTDNYDELTDEILEMLRLRPFVTATDEELKDAIIRLGMLDFLEIKQDVSRKYKQPPTRMDVVKKLAKQEILNRFKKFPKSRVSVVPFGDQPVTLFDDGEPERVEGELDKLSSSGISITHSDGGWEATGNGTDILKSIRRGMDLCRVKPSAVGIHHFILVTDGEDFNAASTIPTWVPTMKASGVVLDYIHIGDSQVNEGLRQACKDLGGDFVVVNTEKDLEEKFVQAINRLCLPPASVPA